jgi:hypothetical protein
MIKSMVLDFLKISIKGSTVQSVYRFIYVPELYTELAP